MRQSATHNGRCHQPAARGLSHVQPTKLGCEMSRSKRKTPITGITTAETEADEKAKWHRRHRREERARLKTEGQDYIARSHKEHSNPWLMGKDGKTYWG